MKKQRGETQVQLDVEDRKFLDRLLTQTGKPYEFATDLRRRFTRMGAWSTAGERWESVDLKTTTMPRKALLKNIDNARKAIQKADTMLAEWQESIKSL